MYVFYIYQRFYRYALKDHPNDLEGMREACLAVFHHYTCQHLHCPTGRESWCKHNEALALGRTPPPQSPSIPPDYVKYLQPIWMKLCEPELLRKCLLGATQNRNESFNNLVWARAPKTEFTGLDAVRLAVSQAVVVFNSGCKAACQTVLENAGIDPGHYCVSHLTETDKRRLKRADKAADATAKRRRKSKKSQERVADAALVEEEGVMYESAAFDEPAREEA